MTVSNRTFTNLFTIPVVVGGILGINNQNLDNQITVSQNPFINCIKIKGQTPNSIFELIDLQGKILYSGIDIEKVDFSYLSKGIYLPKVKNDSIELNLKLCKN